MILLRGFAPRTRCLLRSSSCPIVERPQLSNSCGCVCVAEKLAPYVIGSHELTCPCGDLDHLGTDPINYCRDPHPAARSDMDMIDRILPLPWALGHSLTTCISIFPCLPSLHPSSVQWRPNDMQETICHEDLGIRPPLTGAKIPQNRETRVRSRKTPFFLWCPVWKWGFVDSKHPCLGEWGKWGFFDSKTLFSRFWGFEIISDPVKSGRIPKRRALSVWESLWQTSTVA